eukprot:jgi/Mesvir1/12009/Mv00312-RA.1
MALLFRNTSREIQTPQAKPVHAIKNFLNSDKYIGDWLDGKPHGKGKYVWADGSQYDGEWKSGKKHGYGKYTWTSGATYEGDWVDNCMQGVGTHVGPDGSRYHGSWRQDKKHGLGTKTFGNGDIYEGLWNNGVSEGPGRYVWANGNEYNGEWKDGTMNGKGTFLWSTQDRYDGEWKDGKEHGAGVFAWADGACFEGTWAAGFKHGTGKFYPQGLPWHHRRAKATRSNRTGHSSAPPVGMTSGSDTEGLGASMTLESEGAAGTTGGGGTEKGGVGGVGGSSGEIQTVMVRAYNMGFLLEEHALEVKPVDVKSRHRVGGMTGRRHHRMRSFSVRPGHHLDELEPARPGETIFKGHTSYDLMINLQLGIRWTVGKTTRAPSYDLQKDDFSKKANVLHRFPRQGSTVTPPHPGYDFKFKDYCPMVFRQLRERFKIDAGDYMLSLCGDGGLREMPSPGKSGSMFYLSHNDRYIIKTMAKAEMKMLRQMLPDYYKHVMEHPSTLLTKFFGLHRLKPHRGRKVRFVVMGNLLCTDLRLHYRFDLKGSTLGRKTEGKTSATTTLKDLDLQWYFKLEEAYREKLLRQVEVDCAFLERLSIMDYSMLLGVHERATPSNLQIRFNGATGPGGGIPRSPINPVDPISSVANVKNFRLAGVQTPTQVLAISPHRTDTFRPVQGSEGGTDALTHLFGRSTVTVGLNMAATAVPLAFKGREEEVTKVDVKDVVLYFGIIDMLQQYDISKILEHRYKALFHGGQAISAVDPLAYSTRFQAFMAEIFT